MIGQQLPQPQRRGIAALTAVPDPTGPGNAAEATGWDPSVDGPVSALAVASDGQRVWAGGDFAAIGGAARRRLAALDAGTGQATGWNPAPTGGGVEVLAASGPHLLAGGTFGSLGDPIPRAGLAAIDAAVSGRGGESARARLLTLATAALLSAALATAAQAQLGDLGITTGVDTDVTPVAKDSVRWKWVSGRELGSHYGAARQ